MQELLYKYLGKRTASVAKVSAGMLGYEKANPSYFESPYSLVNSSYEIGIEVEVENVGGEVNYVTQYPAWDMHEDGSLRNRGCEFVTLPIHGKRIIYSVNQLFATMPPRHHFSPRTSIHVHLNVLDLRPDQIAGLILTYVPFERLLYRFVGGDRDKNNFCVPMHTSSSYYLIKRFTQDSFSVPNLNNSRYLGLNLDAVRKFGTLEFRHLGGTKDKERIFTWINLIFRLKDYTREYDWRAIHERICGLNTNSAYEAFFRDVFKEDAKHLRSPSLKRDMEDIVSSLKTVVLENPLRQDIRSSLKVATWWKALSEKKVGVDMYAEIPRPVAGRELRAQAVRPRPAERVERARPVAPPPPNPFDAGVGFLGGAMPAGLGVQQAPDERLQQQLNDIQILQQRWAAVPDVYLGEDDE